jgi:MinD superfamily P-loop ATPase
MPHNSEIPLQMVILSGKGGTGKTSLGAAFAHLSSRQNKIGSAVFVDADVDAANLSLVLHPEQLEEFEFWGGSLAEITASSCTGCKACIEVCRYDALFLDPHNPPALWVDPIACDGCAACVYACPEDAVRMVAQQDGYWFHSSTPYGDLFHAELFAGKDNSGKLVTRIKQQARLWAQDTECPLVIIDGPPGIGCPVISASAGADFGLIVAEPGMAGIHDMERILDTLQHFKVPAAICINKADLYAQGSSQIRTFADARGIDVIGEIPFDDHVPKAMLLGAPVTEIFPASPSALSIGEIWEESLEKLLARKER